MTAWRWQHTSSTAGAPAVGALRAVLVDAAAAVLEAAGHDPEPLDGSPAVALVDLDRVTGSFPTPDHETMARALAAPLAALAYGIGLTRASAPADVESTGGEPAWQVVRGQDAGALPAVVVIAGGITIAAAVCFLGWQAAQVVDAALTRDQNARDALVTVRELTALSAAHRERERGRGGAPLPYDPAERAALDALAARSGELADAIARPASPDSGGWGSLAFVAAAALGWWLLAA